MGATVVVVTTGGVVVVVTTALFTIGSVVVVTATGVATDVAGATGTDTAGVVTAGAAAATATTLTVCDAAVDEYTSLPAWLAEMTQEPVDTNVTTPAEMVQTEEEELAMAIVGARNASLSTDTVYVPPGFAGDGKIGRAHV